MATELAQLSAAQRFQLLPREIRTERLAALTPRECELLEHDWSWWSRPNQQLPPGDWTTWLILAGRGYGKTRTGAETVREWAQSHRYVNLIGPTADDARDVMIEGESGILAVCPRRERPVYRPSKRLLVWPNGARSLIFTADEPERLRGKQHGKLWCDEIAAWRYLVEAWDQAMFGLRLGRSPQAVVTTTPKPLKLIRELMGKGSTHVTRGTTYENVANLAPQFLGEIITKYQGTRLGRQELDGDVLEDNPNALWQRAAIDDARVREAPALTRIVVAIDPAVTSNEDSDETGIIAVGRDARSPAHFYVLEDRSLIASPAGWARTAIVSYYALKADRVIGETNNGGEMVESTLRNVDENVSYKAVRASRGKVTRAEPVAALYEQGRVHHVGSLPFLEDQMCDFDPTVSAESPDRMDALVWGVSELMEGTGAESYLDFLERQKAELARAEAEKGRA
jgi:phage terminase large subunit-like protein